MCGDRAVKKNPPMTISQSKPDQLLPPEDEHERPIVLIDAARRSEAIERLVGTGGDGDRAAAERFLHYARTNGVSLEGLWSLLGPKNRVAYSTLAVPSPGRTAMVFASHPPAAAAVPVVARLIDHACRETAARDVHLAQALLEPTETLERRSFVEAGFTELAVLSYLQRPLSKTPPPPAEWPAGVRTRLYRDELHDVLVTILEQSYQETLDCPGLYGLRRTEDIIAGHKATGQYDPSLWTMLWVDERPAGVVLLNPFPDHRTVELVYLGLAPFARGRGLGRQLLRHGLSLLHGRRERTLTLAVDERNAPALAVYNAEGFRPAVHRVALIRSLV